MGLSAKSQRKDDWAVSSPLHNKLGAMDRPIHAWYRFVLSFPPHLVREYFNKFEVTDRDTVLDPFCGTGTTLVEAKKNGIPSRGLEANPMAAMASRVKTDWKPKPSALLAKAESIAELAKKRFQADGLDLQLARVKEQLTLYGLLDLNEEQNKLILANSISPRPLHRSLVIKSLIDDTDQTVRDHLRLALAWTLVNSAGNIRFGPEVGVTTAKTDADVVGDWLAQVRRMSSDLDQVVGRVDCFSSVDLADSRSIPSSIPDRSIDYVFTSPPYPNEKDYTRTTRLESVVLGLIKTKAELRQLKQGLVRSNTRNVYVTDDDHLLVEAIPEIHRLSEQIEARRIELMKTSGFERLYHRVAKLYFGGMAKHFRELRRVLKPGAMLGYVVGDQASYLRVMIRTGQLLGQVAECEGYELVGIDLFRTRYATATREQLREEVVILRWPGG
jgi:hypothetical protein